MADRQSLLSIPKDIERTPSLVACEQHVGNYAVHHTLSRGSFGKVKLGRHLLSNEPVAIKIVDKSKVNMRSIKYEAQVWKGLHHNHIARLLEVRETTKWLFMVMECAPRGELFDLIVTRGYIQEPEAKRYFVQVVSALAYCHSKGIVHRDLKPENLLLDEHRNIKLIDFGFAAKVERGTKLDLYCGSSAYASPEIVLERPYDGYLSDLWSLGVVLYAMVVGALPFDGDTEDERIDAVVSGKYVLHEELSAPLRDLLQRLLTRKPSHRLDLEGILTHPWLAPKPGAKIVRLGAPIIPPGVLAGYGESTWGRPITAAERMYVCMMGTLDGSVENSILCDEVKDELMNKSMSLHEIEDGMKDDGSHVCASVFLLTAVRLRKMREEILQTLFRLFPSGRYSYEDALALGNRLFGKEAAASAAAARRVSPPGTPSMSSSLRTTHTLAAEESDDVLETLDEFDDPEQPEFEIKVKKVHLQPPLLAKSMLDMMTPAPVGGQITPPTKRSKPGPARKRPSVIPGRVHGPGPVGGRTPPPPKLTQSGTAANFPAAIVAPPVQPRTKATAVAAQSCAATIGLVVSEDEPTIPPRIGRRVVSPPPARAFPPAGVPKPPPSGARPRAMNLSIVTGSEANQGWSSYDPVDIEDVCSEFVDVYVSDTESESAEPCSERRQRRSKARKVQLVQPPQRRYPPLSVESALTVDLEATRNKRAGLSLMDVSQLDDTESSTETNGVLRPTYSRDRFIPPADPMQIRVVEDTSGFGAATTTRKSGKETRMALFQATATSIVEVRRLGPWVCEGRIKPALADSDEKKEYRVRIEVCYVRGLRMHAVSLHRDVGTVWVHKEAMQNLQEKLARFL